MASYPPLVDDVRAWLQVPATVVPDPMLQDVMDAELVIQAELCRVPDPTTWPVGTASDLVQALYRRVGRVLAARAVPLGVLGTDAEYGGVYLGRWDAEVARLEGPTRRLVMG